ncbi:MAG: hypothetical protein QM737_00285 [Ferruginibacter sp.]
MKEITTFLFFILCLQTQAQITSQFVNTNDKQIDNAVAFYKSYLQEFENNHLPDYKKFWSSTDCEKYKTPDPIVYLISSDYPTYNYAQEKTIFYVRNHIGYVHLKTLLTNKDSLNNMCIIAITNHYIEIDKNDNAVRFINPLEINKDLYRTTKNQDITYIYPKGIHFNKAKSDSLILKIRAFEKLWSFKPIAFEYYFTNTQDELGALRGLDYFFGMEQSTASGMTFCKDKIIYCNGNGEDYFHEVLHLYLNPLYENSPVNHGLIYYLGGSLGFSFDELINKMNLYLEKYPETNLGDFETLKTKDIQLNIYNIVTGLISKIIYEKEAVEGIKRLLKYKNIEDIFQTEFHIEKQKWDRFLKTNFKKYNKPSK